MKAVEVSRDSWHYKLLTCNPWPFTGESSDDDVPKSICGYFWAVVFFLLFGIPLYVLAILPLVVLARFVVWPLIRFIARLIRGSAYVVARCVPDRGLRKLGFAGSFVIAKKRRLCPRVVVK